MYIQDATLDMKSIKQSKNTEKRKQNRKLITKEKSV